MHDLIKKKSLSVRDNDRSFSQCWRGSHWQNGHAQSLDNATRVRQAVCLAVQGTRNENPQWGPRKRSRDASFIVKWMRALPLNFLPSPWLCNFSCGCVKRNIIRILACVHLHDHLYRNDIILSGETGYHYSRGISSTTVLWVKWELKWLWKEYWINLATSSE